MCYFCLWRIELIFLPFQPFMDNIVLAVKTIGKCPGSETSGKYMSKFAIPNPIKNVAM